MTKDTLLLIDFQVDFLSPKGRMSVGEENPNIILQKANKLIDYFKEPTSIVYIGNEFKRNDIIGDIFRRFASLENTEGAKSEGLEVIVIEDAITSNKAFRKKWAPKKLLKANVEIMTTEEYIEEST